MEPKLLTSDRFIDSDTGCSYRYVHSSTEYFRPHYHDYYEIFIPLKGKALHIVNGETVSLCRGMAVFIRPSDTHDYVCAENESFDMLNVSFTPETVASLFSYFDDNESLSKLTSPRLPPTVRLSDQELDELDAEMNRIRLIDSDKRLLKRALRRFLLNIMTEHFLEATHEEGVKDIPTWLIELRERLREDNNFIEGIPSIERLSGKSREHISRCMKKYYGVTVSEYINDLRLSYIANMLRYSNHDVLNIIFESGFGNVSWCYKCFAKKYGMSMAKYRRS